MDGLRAACCGFVAVLSGTALATDLYIDPVLGDNSNPGTDSAQPSKTVTHALNMIAEPRFVNPDLMDFHLLPDSPAIDTADPNGARAFRGRLRPRR